MSKAKYYNEDLKLKFAAEAEVPPSYKRYVAQLFNASYSKEEELQKDIGQWSRNEIIKFLEENVSFAYGTYKTHIFSLNAYLLWCDKEFSPIELQEVEFSKVQKNNLFGSPEDLQNWLDRAFDPIKLNSLAILHRTHVWLCYMGIPDGDLLQIDISDVNTAKKIISVGGVNYRIPKEAIPTIKRCKSLEEFIKYGSTIYKVNRVEGPMFLRRTNEGKDHDKQVKQWRHSASIASKLPVQTQAIRRSGIFYRMYTLEQQGITPNYLQAYSEFAEGASDWIRNNRKSVYISSTKIEYEAWKKAFYPETKI